MYFHPNLSSNVPKPTGLCDNDRRDPQHGKQHPKEFSGSKMIGYHSVDRDRNYLPGASKLLYHNPPKEEEGIFMNLDDGREKAVRRNASFEDEGISLLTQWIVDNRQKVVASPDSENLLQPDFVCSRGTLIKFMMAPYCPLEKWKLFAAKWKGTIYLRSDKKVQLYTADKETNKKFTSWGHKFEQYILSESPHKAPDTTKPVLEPEKFRGIHQIQAGKYSVLFSTVMKGVCSNEVLEEPLPLNKLIFVDLKTSRIITNPGQQKTLRKHKFLKWWAMGFLTNTEKLLVGFRDDNGVVQRLTEYTLNQMVAMSRSYWNPEECRRCCETFLKKITDTVVDECDKTVYEFSKVSNEDFNITEYDPSEKRSVITESYMDAMG